MSTRIPALAAKRDKNQKSDSENPASSSDGPAKKKKKLDAKIVFWIKWIFLISSVIGVSLDPFLFQSPVIKEDKKCLSFDKRLYITAIIVRSVTDLIYFANMMLAISEAYRSTDKKKIIAQKQGCSGGGGNF
ncbi:Cyclic nucleotide-gated ion channel 1 [Morella rubra]|uniref:Cyclic nucleotide-gated ion channel 1 n=1 Tax=Morella rubra TaxID=262757 RepID=A0A6A1V4P4_9ROSI|nr:Cyclic nucleotide-gated ion channel 1 [Morella rubra]